MKSSSASADAAGESSLDSAVDGWPRLSVDGLASGVWGGLHQADTAFVLAAAFCQNSQDLLWICRSNSEAEERARDLRFFLPPQWHEALTIFPGSDADPYRGLSPHPEILARRAMALWRIARLERVFVLTTPTALMSRMPSAKSFLAQCLQLEVGETFPRRRLLDRLREAGYVREDPVRNVGEYSIRGGIIDIFSPSRERPVRIELFGDQIESIREFDLATQRSIELVPVCEAVPMREMSVSSEDVGRWHEAAPDYWSEVRFAEALLEKRQFTENGELFNGFETVFPVVIDLKSDLLSYRVASSASWNVVMDSDQDLQEILRDRMSELQEIRSRRDSEGDLTLPPEKLFWGPDWWRKVREQVSRIGIERSPDDSLLTRRFDFRSERRYQGRFPELVADLAHWRQAGERAVFVMSTRGMAERMRDILAEYDVTAQLFEGGFEKAESFVAVTHARLSESFASASLRLHVLTQGHVFEEKEQRRPAPRRSKQEISGVFLSDFRDLKPGDFVVHIDHGIGQYQGLKQIGVDENSKEFALLAYRGGAKLYVPVDRLDLVQKYSSSGHSRPQLDKLGGASWEKTKKRIKKSMRDMADELLKLYAQRAMIQGHVYPPDDEMMREFEEAFEYELTPDQAAAIKDIRADMESDRPMDRLVCGDVGYGKTEVAMRAAFKAVEDSRQVAVLAPTTVLAFQHLNTFRRRFQGFPVQIEMISRFRSRKEAKEILAKTAAGEVDILIGTHRLLSKDVGFARLGLVIVDEEQRFGVAHKEKLKRLRTQADILTLSATPIPRTLNMSMIGLRDLSIIETPPQDRLAIQTVVVKFNRQIIRSAMDLELKRSGQVFFLHNSVETLPSIVQMVKEICPEARVVAAHGQMREALLEEVMLDFLEYRYDILVSTTIIENGLDIPRANTLIVNRADRFGLSQLYQLRGRVGRSNRRAYAYLLIAPEETLSLDAQRRLRAIREFSDLGAGFRVAALDLEIRGAGNLLGGEQHGQINAVGFELYTKLLDQAIQELKGRPSEPEIQTSLDLGIEIQIPEHYIEHAPDRLWLYKRIALARDADRLTALAEETADRYGKFPRSVVNLMESARLRLKSRALRVLSIDRRAGRFLTKFRADTPLSAEALIEWVQRHDEAVLTPEGVLVVPVSGSAGADVLNVLSDFLDELTMLQ